jgi:4-hydroxybenzoate polyprenyltransferase
MTPYLRLLRPHQWTKNLLLLVPAVAAHRSLDTDLLVSLGSAFVLFSLMVSGFYIVNDLLDLEHDRAHPSKKDRPLAAGEIGPPAAGVLAAVLVTGSVAGMVALLPRAFVVSALVYAVLALGYSLGLKRSVLLDVLVLAALYSVRVVAGAAAVDVPLSRWFLAFSVFVFLSLALVKRAVELRALASSTAESRPAAGNDAEQAPGRGWRVDDLPTLYGMGTASALAGVLVYCLYITSPDVLRLYTRPDYLWLGLPMLLYWLGRIWILVARDEVADDPVLFAVRDPSSYAIAALLAVAVWLAT